MALKRLLYLGFALPPGLAAQHPELNPAGHAFETRMIEALRAHFEIRSVGLLPFEVTRPFPTSAAVPGLAHALCLVERAPELWHRWRSFGLFRRAFTSWQRDGWSPEAVLVYNLSPVYNACLRWLQTHSHPARRILVLADSPQLGQLMSRLKRLRYRFKPMVRPDQDMLGVFDACISLSNATAQYFAPLRIPWLWMPGGCDTASVGAFTAEPVSEPEIVFGYGGALAPHTGVRALVDQFLACPLPNRLHLCGYGKLAEHFRALAQDQPRLQFHGFLPDAQGFASVIRACDVLVNPRPPGDGSENNFPSKIFQYALAGRAILTTRLSGVDEVLGDCGYYLDPHPFEPNLRGAILSLARVSREELARRGAAARERVLSCYSWSEQARRMAEFILRSEPARPGVS